MALSPDEIFAKVREAMVGALGVDEDEVTSVVSILGLERALADRPVWRRTARCGWGLLLGFSVAFNLIASVVHYAEVDNDVGVAFEQVGRMHEAIERLEHALRIRPDYVKAHVNLGIALQSTGRLQEAIGHYEQALRIKPDYALAHYNLGVALEHASNVPEAIGHYEQALRFKPDYAEARNALARLQARQ